MRYVKFIKGLLIDERPVLSGREIQYHAMEPMPVPLSPDECLLPEQTVETAVVPIHELRGCTKHHPHLPDELYIAYSREVQDLLEMPFDTMKRQLDNQSMLIVRQIRELDDIRNASVWKRLRFLFTRRFDKQDRGEIFYGGPLEN